jgi:hypothetical protein
MKPSAAKSVHFHFFLKKYVHNGKTSTEGIRLTVTHIGEAKVNFSHQEESDDLCTVHPSSSWMA